MKRLAQVGLRWGSAAGLAYLALFFWVDAISRVIGGPYRPAISIPVAMLTVALAGRSLLYQESWSWALSLAALAGLILSWHPILIAAFVGGAVLWAIVAQHQPRKKTVLAHQVPFPIPVRLTTTDRFLHLHVLGPTGSGKSSSVLMPLIAQDLVHGHGIFLLEPKGDLTRSAYRRAIDAGRSVMRFDPTQTSCPHVNPLSGPAEEAAEGLAWCLNQISGSGHPYYAVAARVQLLHAVRVIKDHYGDSADLGHVLEFFRHTGLQKQIVLDSQDTAAQNYFQEQWQRKAGAGREDRQGLLNRLELLWASPAVRRVLTAPADFTWDEILNERWVLLCSLSLAQLGESARALGSLLWHGLAQAAYRRNPAVPAPPFFAYLDEFYQWVNDDIGDFLALARGYFVGLVLAHQDMGQLSPTLQEAVMANARHRIILPGSAPEDVARFQRGAQPYNVNPRLRYLRRGRAVLQTTHDGRLNPPRMVRLAYIRLGGSGHES